MEYSFLDDALGVVLGLTCECNAPKCTVTAPWSQITLPLCFLSPVNFLCGINQLSDFNPVKSHVSIDISASGLDCIPESIKAEALQIFLYISKVTHLLEKNFHQISCDMIDGPQLSILEMLLAVLPAPYTNAVLTISHLFTVPFSAFQIPYYALDLVTSRLAKTAAAAFFQVTPSYHLLKEYLSTHNSIPISGLIHAQVYNPSSEIPKTLKSLSSLAITRLILEASTTPPIITPIYEQRWIRTIDPSLNTSSLLTKKENGKSTTSSDQLHQKFDTSTANISPNSRNLRTEFDYTEIRIKYARETLERHNGALFHANPRVRDCTRRFLKAMSMYELKESLNLRSKFADSLSNNLNMDQDSLLMCRIFSFHLWEGKVSIIRHQSESNFNEMFPLSKVDDTCAYAYDSRDEKRITHIKTSCDSARLQLTDFVQSKTLLAGSLRRRFYNYRVLGEARTEPPPVEPIMGHIRNIRRGGGRLVYLAAENILMKLLAEQVNHHLAITTAALEGLENKIRRGKYQQRQQRRLLLLAITSYSRAVAKANTLRQQQQLAIASRQRLNPRPTTAQGSQFTSIDITHFGLADADDDAAGATSKINLMHTAPSGKPMYISRKFAPMFTSNVGFVDVPDQIRDLRTQVLLSSSCKGYLPYDPVSSEINELLPSIMSRCFNPNCALAREDINWMESQARKRVSMNLPRCTMGSFCWSSYCDACMEDRTEFLESQRSRLYKLGCYPTTPSILPLLDSQYPACICCKKPKCKDAAVYPLYMDGDLFAAMKSLQISPLLIGMESARSDLKKKRAHWILHSDEIDDSTVEWQDNDKDVFIHMDSEGKPKIYYNNNIKQRLIDKDIDLSYVPNPILVGKFAKSGNYFNFFDNKQTISLSKPFFSNNKHPDRQKFPPSPFPPPSCDLANVSLPSPYTLKCLIDMEASLLSDLPALHANKHILLSNSVRGLSERNSPPDEQSLQELLEASESDLSDDSLDEGVRTTAAFPRHLSPDLKTRCRALEKNAFLPDDEFAKIVSRLPPPLVELLSDVRHTEGIRPLAELRLRRRRRLMRNDPTSEDFMHSGSILEPKSTKGLRPLDKAVELSLAMHSAVHAAIKQFYVLAEHEPQLANLKNPPENTFHPLLDIKFLQSAPVAAACVVLPNPPLGLSSSAGISCLSNNELAAFRAMDRVGILSNQDAYDAVLSASERSQAIEKEIDDELDAAAAAFIETLISVGGVTAATSALCAIKSNMKTELLAALLGGAETLPKTLIKAVNLLDSNAAKYLKAYPDGCSSESKPAKKTRSSETVSLLRDTFDSAHLANAADPLLTQTDLLLLLCSRGLEGASAFGRGLCHLSGLFATSSGIPLEVFGLDKMRHARVGEATLMLVSHLLSTGADPFRVDHQGMSSIDHCMLRHGDAAECMIAKMLTSPDSPWAIWQSVAHHVRIAHPLQRTVLLATTLDLPCCLRLLMQYLTRVSPSKPPPAPLRTTPIDPAILFSLEEPHTGLTPLLVAAAHDHSLCLTVLVEEFAVDVNQPSLLLGSLTPLLMAAGRGCWANVHYLIDKGADASLAIQPSPASPRTIGLVEQVLSCPLLPLSPQTQTILPLPHAGFLPSPSMSYCEIILRSKWMTFARTVESPSIEATRHLLNLLPQSHPALVCFCPPSSRRLLLRTSLLPCMRFSEVTLVNLLSLNMLSNGYSDEENSSLMHLAAQSVHPSLLKIVIQFSVLGLHRVFDAFSKHLSVVRGVQDVAIVREAGELTRGDEAYLLARQFAQIIREDLKMKRQHPEEVAWLGDHAKTMADSRRKGRLPVRTANNFLISPHSSKTLYNGTSLRSAFMNIPGRHSGWTIASVTTRHNIIKKNRQHQLNMIELMEMEGEKAIDLEDGHGDGFAFTATTILEETARVVEETADGFLSKVLGLRLNTKKATSIDKPFWTYKGCLMRNNKNSLISDHDDTSVKKEAQVIEESEPPACEQFRQMSFAGWSAAEEAVLTSLEAFRDLGGFEIANAQLLADCTKVSKRLTKALMQTNLHGETPAHIAARDGSVENLETLLALGASAWVRTTSGRTCLDYAVIGGNLASIVHLLRLGGFHQNAIQTAYLLAFQKRDTNIMHLLSSWGADHSILMFLASKLPPPPPRLANLTPLIRLQLALPAPDKRAIRAGLLPDPALFYSPLPTPSNQASVLAYCMSTFIMQQVTRRLIALSLRPAVLSRSSLPPSTMKAARSVLDFFAATLVNRLTKTNRLANIQDSLKDSFSVLSPLELICTIDPLTFQPLIPISEEDYLYFQGIGPANDEWCELEDNEMKKKRKILRKKSCLDHFISSGSEPQTTFERCAMAVMIPLMTILFLQHSLDVYILRDMATSMSIMQWSAVSAQSQATADSTLSLILSKATNISGLGRVRTSKDANEMIGFLFDGLSKNDSVDGSQGDLVHSIKKFIRSRGEAAIDNRALLALISRGDVTLDLDGRRDVRRMRRRRRRIARGDTDKGDDDREYDFGSGSDSDSEINISQTVREKLKTALRQSPHFANQTVDNLVQFKKSGERRHKNFPLKLSESRISTSGTFLPSAENDLNIDWSDINQRLLSIVQDNTADDLKLFKSNASSGGKSVESKRQSTLYQQGSLPMSHFGLSNPRVRPIEATIELLRRFTVSQQKATDIMPLRRKHKPSSTCHSHVFDAEMRKFVAPTAANSSGKHASLKGIFNGLEYTDNLDYDMNEILGKIRQKGQTTRQNVSELHQINDGDDYPSNQSLEMEHVDLSHSTQSNDGNTKEPEINHLADKNQSMLQSGLSSAQKQVEDLGMNKIASTSQKSSGHRHQIKFSSQLPDASFHHFPMSPNDALDILDSSTSEMENHSDNELSLDIPANTSFIREKIGNTNSNFGTTTTQTPNIPMLTLNESATDALMQVVGAFRHPRSSPSFAISSWLHETTNLATKYKGAIQFFDDFASMSMTDAMHGVHIGNLKIQSSLKETLLKIISSAACFKDFVHMNSTKILVEDFDKYACEDAEFMRLAFFTRVSVASSFRRRYEDMTRCVQQVTLDGVFGSTSKNIRREVDESQLNQRRHQHIFKSALRKKLQQQRIRMPTSNIVDNFVDIEKSSTLNRHQRRVLLANDEDSREMAAEKNLLNTMSGTSVFRSSWIRYLEKTNDEMGGMVLRNDESDRARIALDRQKLLRMTEELIWLRNMIACIVLMSPKSMLYLETPSSQSTHGMLVHSDAELLGANPLSGEAFISRLGSQLPEFFNSDLISLLSGDADVLEWMTRRVENLHLRIERMILALELDVKAEGGRASILRFVYGLDARIQDTDQQKFSFSSNIFGD